MIPETKISYNLLHGFNALVASAPLEWWTELCVCLCTVGSTVETAVGTRYLLCASFLCWQFSSNTPSGCCEEKSLFQIDNSLAYGGAYVEEPLASMGSFQSIWPLAWDPQHGRTLLEGTSCWCIWNKFFLFRGINAQLWSFWVCLEQLPLKNKIKSFFAAWAYPAENVFISFFCGMKWYI